MIKMVSSSTAYCGKPLRSHSHPADVAPPRPEGQANPLSEHILPRQFPAVNGGRISSWFRVAAVLDSETKLARNTTSLLFLDGIKCLQGHCSGPD